MWRRVLRAVVPRGVRRAARISIREFPVRFRDFPADMFDRSLPPPRLRYRVAGTSDRRTFVTIGRGLAGDLLRVVGERKPEKILDFGVGCGRVARHVGPLTGVDVDRQCVAWCRAHLPGEFRAIHRTPPLPFDGESFDWIYAVSVFSHLPRGMQTAWLSDLARVLKRDGILTITTLSPALAYTRPDMTRFQREELETSGFVFLAGGASFNEDTSFQSEQFLRDAAPELELIHYEQHGLAGYQDIAAFVRS